MPLSATLPRHLRRPREKVFGDGRPRPLDRNAKVRIKMHARALMRRTEKGKAYGDISAKAYAVLEALLWHFHNARNGLCFPSYEKIADAAGCARSTVAECIKALEQTGILSWVNRIVRIRERCPDLFGRFGSRIRVIRTSNAYHFRDPLIGTRPDLWALSSKSEILSGTSNQESITLQEAAAPRLLDPDNPLEAALLRLGKTIGAIGAVAEA